MFRSLLTVCAGCGAWRCSKDVLCDFCFKKYFSNSRVLWKKDLPICSFVSWNPESHRFLSKLIQMQKGGWPLRFYKELARGLSKTVPLTNSSLLIPVPSFKNKRRHSVHFAKALSKASGTPTWEGLVNLSREKQSRQKDPARRTRVSIGLREGIQKPRKSGTDFILVDDVVTTGNTLLAAREALGNPKSIQALSIACRSE